jgi:GDPmannose 4,6-dehydratase
MVDADIEALACAGSPWIDKVNLASWSLGNRLADAAS